MRVLTSVNELAIEKRRPVQPRYEALADAVTAEILRM